MSDQAETGAFKMRVSIFQKIIIPVLALLLLAMGVATYIGINLESKALKEQLKESVKTTAMTTATISRNAFNSLNWIYLEEFLHGIDPAGSGGIISAKLVNADGEVYMAHDREYYGTTMDPELLSSDLTIHEDYFFQDYDINGLLIVYPVQIGQQQWYVFLGASLAHVEEAINELIKRSVLWSMIIVVLATIAIAFIIRTIVRPISSLVKSVNRISKGDLEHETEVTSKDEIGLLSHEFNKMVKNLRSARADLENSMRELEITNQQLEEETAQAKRLAVAAQQASKAKSEFLANMSHEIRTPLNGVVSMLSLVEETELSSEQEEYVKMAAMSSETLLAIINDILDFSKIEAGKLELTEREFDLENEVADLLSVLAGKAGEKKLEVLMHYDFDAPRFIKGDNLRLRQVLFNIAGNAVKFTDQGHVLLEVKCLRRDHESALLRISVKDTGIGIAPDKQREIFEHFTQADYSSTRKYGGTGLGLAISKEIVKLMGAELKLESTPGQGSEFYFEIRFEIPKEQAQQTSEFHMDNMKILVVDDNEVNQSIISRYLCDIGAECHLVENGYKAMVNLEESIKSGTPYQLAVIDYAMPGMDGLELTQHIRRKKDFDQMPIVMLSSFWGHIPARDLYDAGVDSYLPKPVRRGHLLQAIQGVLEGRREKSAGADSPHEPLDSIHDSNTHESRKQPDADQKSSGSLKILLVEDNPVNRKSVKYMLSKITDNIAVAENGQQAVEMFQSQDFDLILMDVQMPVMDGLEATRQIRKIEKTENADMNNPLTDSDNSSPAGVPIIALTANAMIGDRKKCLEAGMNDYLSKPLRKNDLLSIIEGMIPDMLSASKAQKPGKPDQAISDENCDVPEHMSIFNEKDFMTRYENDYEIASEILKDFLEDLPLNLSQILECVQSADPVSTDKSAHKLKGSAGYIGAEILQHLCSSIMKHARQDHWEQVSIDSMQLKDHVEKFVHAANAFLAQHNN
ncbi:response regulator [Desulfonatronovibrio magnus]|uniref:response regulator n=1 Tax=Desulfonatronovibrio magnus TaxID=698827 RepID=UPI00069890E3|nr:response regulator [Desulfonatronovibrio magnus]